LRPSRFSLFWLADLDRHPTKFLENLLAAAEWPPVIQVYLHRPPHRHPARNREAFPPDGRKCPRSRPHQEMAYGQAGSQKHDANKQALSAVLHQTPKVQPAEFDSIAEVVMNRVFEHLLGVMFLRWCSEMDYQHHRILQGQFARPADDEFLRIMVQVPLVERGWIHRVEELVNIPQIEFDMMGFGSLPVARLENHAGEHIGRSRIVERFFPVQ